MFEVTREIRFCYGHRLLHHAGKCRHLHGHNARAVVTLRSETLDRLGMVVDFGDIKQHLGAWISEHLDHKMLLHQADPLLPILLEQREPVFVLDVNPTAENIAKLIFEQAETAGLPVVSVQLWETDDCHASYQPTETKA
jgi:6-pyruvoyltetrahydropterin/6-carboxytetrahydropterin synthase